MTEKMAPVSSIPSGTPTTLAVTASTSAVPLTITAIWRGDGRVDSLADGYTLRHASWKSIPDLPFRLQVATFNRPRDLESTGSVQPQFRPIVFTQIGRLAKKIESLVNQLRLALAPPASS